MAPNKQVESQARAARAERRAEDAAAATADFQSEARRVADKTARLRALRLAKEAEDRAIAANAPPTAKGRKTRRAKSIPVEKLNAEDDG